MKVMQRLRRLLGKADNFVSVQQVQGQLQSVDIGRGFNANVLMAPVQWIMRTFTQSEPVVERRGDDGWSRAVDHPVERLLALPNSHYDGDALTKALLLSYYFDGNAYLLKVRHDLLRVVQLWYIPHWLIEPRWPTDGTAFISHYDYRPGAAAGTVRLSPRDVVHLRFGLDPANPRKGLSQLKAVMREAMTDEEASQFSAYILQNMGVPGGVISPKNAEALPSQDDVKAMKEHMQQNFTGMRRGEWLVVGAPTDVSQFGFDPNRLMLGPLRDISEERVCAALGLPAAVVGFGAGLQQTKVGATMRELVRLARVNCIEPTQVSIARQLGRQLLLEFEPQPERARIVYDNSGVSMFGEDETERAKRAVMLAEKGIIRVDQAQAMVGAEVDPTQRIYLRPTQNVAVAPGEDGDINRKGEQ